MRNRSKTSDANQRKKALLSGLLRLAGQILENILSMLKTLDSQ